jgi:hypothetical protein
MGVFRGLRERVRLVCRRNSDVKGRNGVEVVVREHDTGGLMMEVIQALRKRKVSRHGDLGDRSMRNWSGLTSALGS